MLKLEDLHAYYGESYILQGLSLEVEKGAIVALLGRNGMGKTTCIHSIIGLVPPRRGRIFFEGSKINHLEAYQIAQRGIALVPQGRRIFPSLSVTRNLTMSARERGKQDPWTLETIHAFFPILRERGNLSGTLLSGGEQQMLCIARALMTNPDLLLMDEPSEGLAPMIVKEIGEIILKLRQRGLSILLVEQNLRLALSVADYVYIVSKGTVVYECTADKLKNHPEAQTRYLGVSSQASHPITETWSS